MIKDRFQQVGIKKYLDELGRNIMTEVVVLRPKTYAYLMNDGSDHKKAKGTKKVYNKTKTYV